MRTRVRHRLHGCPACPGLARLAHVAGVVALAALLAVPAPRTSAAEPPAFGPANAALRARDFPKGDEGYHTYAEIVAEVDAVVAAHPDIVRRFSIGKSYQGRDLVAVQITTGDLPENEKAGVLVEGGAHALEHFGPEAALAVMHWLVDGYGSDARITRLVRTRSVFIVFNLNPDGSEFDISGGRYHWWRKNRQPNPGSRAVGTDLNRNFGWHWGCCGKISRNPASSFYIGAKAFSAPEAAALRRFVASREIDGKQQIRGYLSFHTAGRRVLWPMAWTSAPRSGGMTADDHAVLTGVGKRIAQRNGYAPSQASAWYRHSGTSTDWAWGRWKIFGYTVELGRWDYPSDEKIAPEVGRNRSAVLWFIDAMGCPYKVIGKEAKYCP